MWLDKNLNVILARKETIRIIKSKHDYSTAQIAKYLGMTENTFNCKLKPACLTNYFSYEEDCMLEDLAGCTLITEAKARERGLVVFTPIELEEHKTDEDFIVLSSKVNIESGILTSEVLQALEDGNLDVKELKKIVEACLKVRKKARQTEEKAKRKIKKIEEGEE